MLKRPHLRRQIISLFALLGLFTSACHREVPVPPLPIRNVTRTDNFFDVWPVSPTRAFIVGARGKVLLTEDAGRHFQRIDIGTDLGIFGIQMTDDQNGYLCGQDGLIMRTRDGGHTWQKLDSRTQLFIFAMSFLDKDHGFMVGDRSVVLSTSDGGNTFFKRQLQRIFPAEQSDYALTWEEPVLYGVSFTDPNHGWIVGEFGRIWATDNGGKTWQEQQDSLLPEWKPPPDPSNSDPRFKSFNLPSLFGVSFRDSSNGAATGLEGSIVVTKDGGKTWHFQQHTDRPGGPPDDILPGAHHEPARDPLFAVDLYHREKGVTVGLTGTVLQQQPNDAWAHDPNFPNIPVTLSQVRFFDDQHGWIVGLGVILYTDDGGKNWRFCQG